MSTSNLLFFIGLGSVGLWYAISSSFKLISWFRMLFFNKKTVNLFDALSDFADQNEFVSIKAKPLDVGVA